jgi:hypothetical protein
VWNRALWFCELAQNSAPPSAYLERAGERTQLKIRHILHSALHEAERPFECLLALGWTAVHVTLAVLPPFGGLTYSKI